MQHTDVPVMILCGGKGTRLGESSRSLPKPMVEIGGLPIVRHVIDIYRKHGFSRFVLLTGHMGREIRRHFVYDVPLEDKTYTYSPDLDAMKYGGGRWTVSCLDTGQETQTAGRVLQGLRFLRMSSGEVALTYGDGVSDIDLTAELTLHRSRQHIVTVAAVSPPPRFGELTIEQGVVTEFTEKPDRPSGARINGGFFFLDANSVACRLELMQEEYVDHGVWDIDLTPFEGEPLSRFAKAKELGAYVHDGFWQCMDTPRDVELLNDLAAGGRRPW